MKEHVFIVEWSPPFQKKPGRFESRIVRRYWWGPIAIARLKIPFMEYVTNAWDWIER